jgi:hypothetical protein
MRPVGRITLDEDLEPYGSPGFDEVSEASMSDDPDFQRASSALDVLRQARLSRNKAAAIMVGDLVYQIANVGLRCPEIEEAREAAWVSISALAYALKEEGFACPTLWKAAVGATESWIELLS